MADARPSRPRHPSKEQQLSIEEQQIIAEIQELQRHLRELKAQEGHDDDEELVVPTTKTRTPRRVLVVANRLPEQPGGAQKRRIETHGRKMALQFEAWRPWCSCLYTVGVGASVHREGRRRDRFCLGGVARC